MFAKNKAQLLFENEIVEASYLYWICNSKAFEICLNQHADILRFYGGFFEN